MPVKSISLFVLSLITLSSPVLAAGVVGMESPGKVLRVEFDAAKLSYRVLRFEKEIVSWSRLGLQLGRGAPDFSGGMELVDSNQSLIDERWEQPWGEQREIRKHGLSINLSLKGGEGQRMELDFFVADDGLGFRYRLPVQDGLAKIEVMDELTEFRFNEDPMSWHIGAFQENRYEYPYTESRMSEWKHESCHTPLTLRLEDSLYLSLHEAALTDYSSMTLEATGDNTLKARLFPWSDGVLVRAENRLLSPWRTMIVADSPGGLIENYLVLNLNEPNRLEDTSWVKPGKYVGIWWEMHLGIKSWGCDGEHGATTENTRKYIDFASANGFDGILVEGWNEGWDGEWIKSGDFNFTKAYPDFDIEALSEYAAGKGVSLIGHHETAGNVLNYEAQLEDAFGMLQKYGYRSVKTGYVAYSDAIARKLPDGGTAKEWHHGQHMIRHYRRVLETAAKHKIMLNVHEPIKDTGLRRTYPNMMTREGACGQEFNAWGGEKRNRPDHTLMLPFTRMLAGPMDFTPGIFDLTFEGRGLEPNRVSTTLAKQLALYVVLYSPLQMAADLPENYAKHPEAFEFIKAVPTDWEATQVINGEIGDFITIARQVRGGDEWFLGSITDEQGRIIEVPLGFLGKGRYEAVIYRDADDAHWESNPVAYSIERMEVGAGDTLELRLAAGGGAAVQFRTVE